MLSRLRGRLFASYIVMLTLTLLVTAGTLLVILNTRSAPPQVTYRQLTDSLGQANLRDFAREFTMPSSRRNPNAINTTLATLSTDLRVRVLYARLPSGVIEFDSAGLIAAGQTWNATYEPLTLSGVRGHGVSPRTEGFRGEFTDPTDQSRWLFIAVRGWRPMQRAALNQEAILIFADERPRQTLQNALDDFGAELFPLLLQAAIAGSLIAVVLAGVIARGISRPLQTLALAAGEVARGRYSQRVAVQGPAEVRALALAFNQMSHNVQAAQQAEQDFLANVSHDLKTPLTSIKGYSQAIIDCAAADPIHAAHVIREEADRLNRMVVELTDLARIQAGRLSMKLTPIDLGQLVSAVAQSLAILASEKRLSLQVDAPSMPPIAGDGDRLAQVAHNLIGNAIKCTPIGGEIRVITRVHNRGVELSVVDNGHGIRPDDLSRIFERFYQVDKARGPHRGTGLGLAITREIVTAHNGTITAVSEGEQRGATFTVWLPLPAMLSSRWSESSP